MVVHPGWSDPAKPWTTRPDWQQKKIRAYDPTWSGVILLAFGLPFAAAGAMACWAGLQEQGMGLVGCAVGGSFVLVGLGLVLAGIQSFRAGRRYGASWIELDRVPIPIGGQLVGRVFITRGMPAGQVVKLTLKLRGTNGRSRADMESLRGVETKDTSRTEEAGTNASFAVSIALPDTRRETSAPDSRPRYAWSLDALVLVNGAPTWSATFPDLPVFDVHGQDVG